MRRLAPGSIFGWGDRRCLGPKAPPQSGERKTRACTSVRGVYSAACRSTTQYRTTRTLQVPQGWATTTTTPAPSRVHLLGFTPMGPQFELLVHTMRDVRFSPSQDVLYFRTLASFFKPSPLNLSEQPRLDAPPPTFAGIECLRALSKRQHARAEVAIKPLKKSPGARFDLGVVAYSQE